MLKFLRQIWFPLALIALFLFALPGVVLVILADQQWDEEINAWLKDNLQITYQLALTPWLLRGLLLVPVAILLLYFLKLKRKPMRVSSTFLWRKSIEDLHVNALLQWLRQNVLLILQILTILFLIYSVLGLRFHGAVSRGQHYILLIDSSASMGAVDVKPSRLELAKEEALKIIDAAGDGDFGMVIAFNSKATTMQAYTNNRIKLREAVRSIEQTFRVTRLEEALTLIDGLANPIRSTEEQSVRKMEEKPGEERSFDKLQPIKTTVHFLSDGRYTKIPQAALANLNSRQVGNTSLLGNLQVLYHPMGTGEPGHANNLGIVNFNAVRIGTPDKDSAQNIEALVRVQNFRRDKATATLRLDVYVNGNLDHTAQQVLKLSGRVFRKGDIETDTPDEDVPGESDSKDAGVFKLPPLDLQGNVVLHAYLDKFEDDFPIDNEAWFVLGTLRKTKIAIVSPGNPVLDSFFKQPATEHKVGVEYLTPEEMTKEPYKKLAAGEADLIIYDRCAPAEEADMPQANTMFIDQPPPPWQRGKKIITNPPLIISKKGHPLFRRISSLWDVGIAEAWEFDAYKNLDEKSKLRFLLPDGSAPKDAKEGVRALPIVTKIVEGKGAVPLIFTVPREPYTDLVLTFPLVVGAGDLNTNWPVRPSFPLFILNVVNTLGNVEDAVRTTTVQPGDPLVIRPEAGVETLTITSPGGATTVLRRGPRGEFVFGQTERLGIYQVARNDGIKSALAVNLLDTNESTIDPRGELFIGQDQIKPGQEEIFQPRELWKVILVIALILLVAEWFFYSQRVSV